MNPKFAQINLAMRRPYHETRRRERESILSMLAFAGPEATADLIRKQRHWTHGDPGGLALALVKRGRDEAFRELALQGAASEGDRHVNVLFSFDREVTEPVYTVVGNVPKPRRGTGAHVPLYALLLDGLERLPQMKPGPKAEAYFTREKNLRARRHRKHLSGGRAYGQGDLARRRVQEAPKTGIIQRGMEAAKSLISGVRKGTERTSSPQGAGVRGAR